MKYKNSIRFKAMFLLLVFSLNTIVGFACAMGFNIRFNNSHHKDEIIGSSVHIHKDGNKHHHQNKPVKASNHIHADGKKHEHKSEVAKPLHVEHEAPKKEKDDCCNDEVLKFQNLDKSLNQNAKTTIDTPVFIAILSHFLSIKLFNISKAYPPIYKARFFYPPPPDIRIAIQSFQI